MGSLEPKMVPAVHSINMGNETVEFDAQAFDDAIRNKGVKMSHYRALRSPVGMSSLNDLRRPNADHSAASHGWIYRKAGDTFGFATGNSKHSKITDVGDIEGSTVRVSLPRFYEDGKPIRVSIFDRFYYADDATVSLVPHFQFFQAHETGIDKLAYKVEEVEELIDSAGIEYGPTDYYIDRNGQIVWTGNSRPLSGAVCSIRYLFRPYWYVLSIEHEVRLAAQRAADGDKTVSRMPQFVVLQRERIFENEKRDQYSDTPGSLRQAKGSSEGSFGPR